MNPPAGRLLTLQLDDAKNASIRDRPMRTSTKSASGDFEFRGVPPGSYYLGTVADSLNCRTPVVVGAADIEGVRLDVFPGASVRLQAVTEGDEKPDLSGIGVSLTANGRRYLLTGMFGLGDVRPDHYFLRFLGSPLGKYYLRAARAGETDVIADGLTVSESRSIQIEIVLASDGAKVEGVVRNANQEPAPGATVVLAPDGRSRVDLFRSTTSDQNGHYEFPAIAPGDYRVYAWEDVEPEIWYDPDFLKDYEKQGEKTALEARGRSVVNVRLAIHPDPK